MYGEFVKLVEKLTTLDESIITDIKNANGRDVYDAFLAHIADPNSQLLGVELTDQGKKSINSIPPTKMPANLATIGSNLLIALKQFTDKQPIALKNINNKVTDIQETALEIAMKIGLAATNGNPSLTNVINATNVTTVKVNVKIP